MTFVPVAAFVEGSRNGIPDLDAVYPTLTATQPSETSHYQQGIFYFAHTLHGAETDASEDETGRGTPLVPVSFNWQVDTGGYALTEEAASALDTSKVKAVSTGYQGDRVIDVESVRPTLPASRPNNGGGSGALLLQQAVIRRLTPKECERLQGFPDDWTRWGADDEEISDTARYRMLGNAVCVNVAEWIGRRLVAALRTKPGHDDRSVREERAA